jgi:hypothetical protein
VGDDLLGAERDLHRLVARQRDGLVHRVGVERLACRPAPPPAPRTRCARCCSRAACPTASSRRSGCGSASATTPCAWRRSARACGAPRCGARRAAWRSPRRSRGGCSRRTRAAARTSSMSSPRFRHSST